MNKTMLKRLTHTITVLVSAVLLFGACQQDELWSDSTKVKEGYVAIQFSTDVPAMTEVQTRAVDPDGGGVQDMTLFCFDRYGLFITTVSALLTRTDVSSGTFEAQVPEHTRTIHFVANQVMTNFPQNSFQGKAEAEVMALLEGSSGRMIYWARCSCSADKNISETLKNTTITMLRNHAKVSVENPENNGFFTVKGFAVYNTNAFGTVAPYHPDKGFDFTPEEWKNGSFVTIPANKAKLSDVNDVADAMGRFVFESENDLNEPVSVILKGHNDGETVDRYYRVMLMQNGEQIPLRRNHDYKINIQGKLSYGQATFAEALKAAATNNVWISISDKVNEVEDMYYILTVEKTSHVIDGSYENNSYHLNYTIKGKGNTTITADDIAEVKWLDNQVALNRIENDFNVVGGEGKGVIRIQLNPLGSNEKLEGTLLVKHGQLQRKIKVILVKKQSFVPSWVGTQIYGKLDDGKRPHVTVMFTVPETCPAELFPMKTYISVAGLDIRAASGMALTVVRNSDKDWYSSGSINPEPDYKYLYVVERPGVQRVYFESVLSQNIDYIGELFIEAEHFETMTRTFSYSDDQKSITISDLLTYNNKDNVPGSAVDEAILYRLVPQKKHAHVKFDLQLMDNQNKFEAGKQDEFLLYSQYLDFYTDEEVGQIGVDKFDCKFYPTESEDWWTKYNPNAGRMLMFKPKSEIIDNNPDGTGNYTIHLKTNRPQSAEVIRIATNLKTQKPILTGDASADGHYGGGSYRSVTFELANYNPFRFGARVKYDNVDYGEEPNRPNASVDVPELLTPIKWTYEPGREVEIAFDVTSFAGSDNKSVDPFGEEFDIYIDAPMLELGDNSTLNNKLRQLSDGRFAYKVEAKREAERKFGSLNPINKDATRADQTNERKVVKFKVKEIVSAGDIVISSDKSKVVFYSKTFRISNKSITGNISLEGGGTVKAGTFVAFEKVSDGSRIGSVTVTADGQYELRLRKEYSFNWYTDEVRFRMEDSAGNVYVHEYTNLHDLFTTPTVVLEQE